MLKKDEYPKVVMCNCEGEVKHVYIYLSPELQSSPFWSKKLGKLLVEKGEAVGLIGESQKKKLNEKIDQLDLPETTKIKKIFCYRGPTKEAMIKVQGKN